MRFAAIFLFALAAACLVGPRPAVVRLQRVLGSAASRGNPALSWGTTLGHRGGGSGPPMPLSLPSSRQWASGPASAGGTNASGSALSGARARMLASAVAGVAVALFVTGPAMALAVPAVVAGTWWLLGRAEPSARARDRRRLDIELPLAAELLAAALTAGCSVGAAVSVVGRALGGPLGMAMCRSAAAADVGSDPVHVWAPLRVEPALVPLARALDAAVARGTSPVPALRRIAEDARLAARWAAQGRARSLGARAAAPLGLCFLPAFVLLAVVPLVATSGAGLF